MVLLATMTGGCGACCLIFRGVEFLVGFSGDRVVAIGGLGAAGFHFL